MRKYAKESFHRLLEWENGSQSSERLAAICIEKFGYSKINPQQPRGGKDGGTDIICFKDEVEYRCCVYFPRGQKIFKEIVKKFSSDVLNPKKKCEQKNVVFFTNQELTVNKREILCSLCGKRKINCDIISIERINNLLNQPEMYGVRLEFLDIEMNKEEQFSFYAANLKRIDKMNKALVDFMKKQNKHIKSKIMAEQIDRNVLFPKIVHHCSYCKFGYEVIGIISILSKTYLIECPKCGNKEFYISDSGDYTINCY